jgi:PAP2 superfamily
VVSRSNTDGLSTPLLDRTPRGAPTTESGVAPRRRPRPFRELALVVALFLVYKAGRAVADGHVGRAYANAVRVWHWERVLDLPSEVHVQHLLMASQSLVRAANVYYAWVHFTAMILFLLWVYLYRPSHYVPLRRLVAAVTAVALAVHLTFPLAPPRLVSGLHMIDTATVFGPSVYGPPSDDTLTNQYAAMPSLHVGWALIIAIGLIRTTRSRWRWCWLIYPVCTFAVVVGTANHYWLDGLVGLAIVAIALRLPVISGHRTPPTRAARIPRQVMRGLDPTPAYGSQPWIPADADASNDHYPRLCPRGATSQRRRATARAAEDHDNDAVRVADSASTVRPTCRSIPGPKVRRHSRLRTSPWPVTPFMTPALPDRREGSEADRRNASEDRTGG